MNRFKFLIFFLSFTVLFISCEDEQNQADNSCTSVSDCKKGEYCNNKVCEIACVDMGCGWDNGVDCGVCSNSNDYCNNNICIDKCYNLECGENRGLDCGVCDKSNYCEENICKLACIDMTCGEDNDISCGTCGVNEICDENNQCKDICENMNCGEVNGIYCGSCQGSQVCNDSNQCKDVCEDMNCGEDDGVSCGACGGNQICNESNQCKDLCENMNCGEDNGLSCGSCESDQICSEENTCLDTMVLIPAGNFMMGCDSSVTDNCNVDEIPYHEVSLNSYKIDLFEVTVEQFKKCVSAGHCGGTYNIYGTNNINCNYGNDTKTNHPMNCVNWYGSKAYCSWLGKRLPTAAEWEKAARGSDARMYPWGNESPSCNYAVYDLGSNGCGTLNTWEIGSKEAGKSFYGLYDMGGNVMEWVNDNYDRDYYLNSSTNNPLGAITGTEKERRGGAWFDSKIYLISYSRFPRDPALAGGGDGFRCAKSE